MHAPLLLKFRSLSLCFLTGYTQYRLFLFAGILVALMSAGLVYSAYRINQDTFYRTLEQDAEVMEKSFNSLLERSYKNMEMIATFIASNNELQQLFYSGKLAVEAEGGGAGGETAQWFRQALYASVAPSWNEVQQRFDVRQLHFHLGPGSLSFLRVHSPKKYGDRMDDLRFTVVDTNKTKQPVYGFETGRVYSGLRGVVPVFAKDKRTGQKVHVGALEVGTSFHTVLDIFDHAYDVGAGVLLNRDHVESTMWPDFIKKRFGGMIFACDCYLEAESRPNQLSALMQMSAMDHNINEEHNHKAMIYHLNDRYYGLTLMPLFDYKSSQQHNHQQDLDEGRVGYIAFWFDRTDAYLAYQQTKRHYLFYGVIGFVFIMIVMAVLTRLYTRHLRHQVEEKTQALLDSTEQLKTAQKVAHIGHWQWDRQSETLDCSDEVFRVFGLPIGSDMSYSIFMSRVHKDDQDDVRMSFKKALMGISCNLTHRVVSHSGGVIYIRNRMQALLGETGKLDKVLGTVQDVSQQIELQLAIENKEKLYQQIFESNRAVQFLVDPDSGRIIDANSAAQNFYGYDRASLCKMTIDQVNVLSLPELREAFAKTQAEGRDYGCYQHRLANGDIRDVEVYTGTVELGDQHYYHSIIFDVTERNQLLTQLRKAAMHDSLTGLFNRRSIDYRSEMEIGHYQRHSQKLSVIMLDIDHFKHFNDTYGHDVGDIVLKNVAQLIEAQVRSCDMVGRFGGEEFIVLASNTDLNRARILAERIIDSIRDHEIKLSGETLKVTISAGIATLGESYFPEEDFFDLKDCFMQLVKHADEKLYQAKELGRDRICG